jgi:hypothetical protein
LSDKKTNNAYTTSMNNTGEVDKVQAKSFWSRPVMLKRWVFLVIILFVIIATMMLTLWTIGGRGGLDNRNNLNRGVNDGPIERREGAGSEFDKKFVIITSYLKLN